MVRAHFYDRHGVPVDTGDPVADTITWGQLRDDLAYMRLRLDHVGDVDITTVWHGINVRLGADPPHIFETMIFGGPHDLQRMTYVTETEALDGHAQALVDLVAGRVPWFLRGD